MPLSENEQVNKTGKALVEVLKSAFGTPPGFRPAHARGIMLRGTFIPTPLAATLTTAPQFNSPATPIKARFSSSTGLPNIPDTDPGANPRGMAIRFDLGDRKHTDILANSTSFFPASTGEGFLEFLGALGNGPTAVEHFLAEHPAAAAFVQAPKPSPESFGTQQYWGVNAFKFVNKDGKETYFRYRIVPEEGVRTLGQEALKNQNKGENYLFDEIRERITTGHSVMFQLMAQLAREGDPTDDPTVYWPEDREVVQLGRVMLDRVFEESENLREQKYDIFDPIPRVEGVEPSMDPLIDVRAALYLISGRERRAA